MASILRQTQCSDREGVFITLPFKTDKRSLITPLLNNCESWIGIKDPQVNLLQKFQEEFIGKVLRISNKTTKAIINWDVGLPPMKWRIAERKMQFLRKTMAKDYKNITKKSSLPRSDH